MCYGSNPLPGRAGFLLISGDPGVGKTRFVRELSSAAQSGGACVLDRGMFYWGQCALRTTGEIIAEYFENRPTRPPSTCPTRS